MESAKVAGIKEARVRFLAFVICGALAGISGMLYTANYAMCTYTIGDGYELQAIAICILGGVSITGGRGTVDGVFIGWLMMSVIASGIVRMAEGPAGRYHYCSRIPEYCNGTLF